MANPLPLISIITPSYNSVRFIKETIESVFIQEYPFFEHIIVDGGSKDGTIEILRCYKHLRWISEPDKGQADALNKGLKIARGKYLGWINADDTYQPEAFVNAMRYLEDNPDIDVVYGDRFVIDENERKLSHFVSREFNLSEYLIEDYIRQQAAFFRREAIEEIGGWDDTLHYVMDYDLFLRLGVKHKLFYVPETWGNFRVYEGTKTTSKYGVMNFRKERLRVIKKILFNQELPLDVQLLSEDIIRHSESLLSLAIALDHYEDDNIECAKGFLEDVFRLESGLLNDNWEELIIDILTWLSRSPIKSPTLFVEKLLKNLPQSLKHKRSKLYHCLYPSALELEIHQSYQSQDFYRCRRCLYKLLFHSPKALKNRGIVSIGLNVMFGKKFSNLIQRYGRNLISSS